MFPIDIPPGTTVHSLMTKVVLDLHKRHVTEAAKEPLSAVTRLEGGKSYTFTVRGRDLHVEEGERERVPLWMSVRHATVERFLADWGGPKKYVPRFVPAGGLVMMS